MSYSGKQYTTLSLKNVHLVLTNIFKYNSLSNYSITIILHNLSAAKLKKKYFFTT